MATHSSVLAWRIPGTGEPGGLPSVGSRRVGHDWSDLAAAAAAGWTINSRESFLVVVQSLSRARHFETPQSVACRAPLSFTISQSLAKWYPCFLIHCLVCHSFSFKEQGLLILWLQSPSAVMLEPKKIKSVTVSTFPPSICHEVMGLNALISVFFKCWALSQLVDSSLSLSSRGSLVPLCFLPLECYHLHIWGCWYLSQQSWLQLITIVITAWDFAWCTLHIS